MIVLNEEKELVRVESWDEIIGRPGFTNNLDPNEHELSKIIGQYAFSDKIACGLSNCHTPHARGYLVATKSGQETNIGKDCGKSYFGVDFVDLATQFDRDMRDKEARERLWSFSFKLDEIKATIRDLREGENGADRLYRRTRSLVEPGKQVPLTVIRKIANMLKTGDSSLSIDREATKHEIEMEEARLGRKLTKPLFVSEKISDEPMDIDSMTSKQLLEWSKWVGTVEQRLDTARHSLELARALLKRSNLSSFMQIIENTDEREDFNNYLNSLP